MGVLGDKLAAAIQQKKDEKIKAKNDVNTWVWKGPKQEVAGVRCQSTIKLMDATLEQLKEWYQHCNSMLFKESESHPGRYVLKSIVQDQINKCATELCIRWIEGRYTLKTDSETKNKLPRNLLFQDLTDLLNSPENKQAIPKEKWNKVMMSSCMNNLPVEFRDVSVKQIIDGCLDLLGDFNRRYITLTFILKFGVNLSPEDFQQFNKDKDKKVLEAVREALKLPSYLKIHKSNSGLSYKDLEYFIYLRKVKYSAMSNDKLLLLKNVILNRLLNEIEYQINQWETIIKRLDYVAKEKYNVSLIPNMSDTE